MEPIVTLVLLAALLTATALAAGIFSMAMGGEFDQKHSDQFMMARVSSQAVALAVMLVAFFLGN